MGTTFFVYYTVYYIFMGFYLYSLSPRLILTISIAFIPVLITQFLRIKIKAKFEDEAAPIRREVDYYQEVITSREYFKETRLLGAYTFFQERLLSSLKRLNKAQWKMFRKSSLIEIIISAVNIIGYVVMLYMLVMALLTGEISAGAFAAVFASIGFFFWMMSRMINDHLGGMMSNLGMANNFIRFMELPERDGESFVSDGSGIIAQNVHFTYPHAKSSSVDDVSLEIEAGETVAIVGENGAGKTTLVRLLMGIYAPSFGFVKLNGMNTSSTHPSCLYENISGVFQKFQRYQMTLAENIRISKIDNTDAIDVVAQSAGINLTDTSFPHGSQTMLSRDFGGVELSGGQWQRVAIARGLYRLHDIIVLDEPTAAIDPIEESRIYQKFIDISKGKTAIIVTHRLGSARIADRIVVMAGGKIVETGTHDELITKNNLYSKMYNAQAEWYE